MLDRDFFARPTVDVARDLVGCRLRVDAGTEAEVVAELVEVEAYLGLDDAASHAHRGPTPRAAIMFGEPGHLYVYLSYGVHHCANVVTEIGGVAGAVLLRAARVISGEDVVRRRRLRAPMRVPGSSRPLQADRLLSGPGNLCRGLGIDLRDNGLDVCSASSRMSVVGAASAVRVRASARVGISQAAERPLRFSRCGDGAVSMPRPM